MKRPTTSAADRTMSRRTLVCGAAGVAFAAAVPFQDARAEEIPTAAAPALPDGISSSDVAQSAVELAPITDFVEEQTVDVVVVGLGCAGVPAVMTALEEGATVACLQKEATASGNGYSASALYKNASTPAGMKRYMYDWSEQSGWHNNTDLFQYWMDHAEETLCFMMAKLDEIGQRPFDHFTSNAVVYENGDAAANFCIVNVNAQICVDLAEQAEKDGAKIYYSTPCVQLVQEADGTVSGAVGRRADGGYVKLNATKAVILAAGDYESNQSLVYHYCRDAYGWYFAQPNRTGDGLILGATAGGHPVCGNHAKQCHSPFAAMPPMLFGPYLHLDMDGNRCMNEEGELTVWGTKLRLSSRGVTPEIYRFWDSAVGEKYPENGDAALADSLLEQYPEEAQVGYKLVRADTLEELVEKLGAPKACLASIERYNELCAKGSDEDFGKDPQYMQPIDTPPYYGAYNTFGIGAINGGLEVDANYQVVDSDGVPIPHLYAAGTNGGEVCGGFDWVMPQGLSNGHCFNAGRYTVVHALTGDLVPTHEHVFEDYADRFQDEDGKFAWETNPRISIPLW